MPLIACLGWGSLVWDPRKLPLQTEWFTDGPSVQVEFLRQSNNGRVTLVLHESAPTVRSLWAVMEPTALDEAKEALRDREGIPCGGAATNIGTWSRGDAAPVLLADLPEWAGARGVDSVVWTALSPKFRGENGRVPSADEVTSYLGTLTGEARDEAKRYICRAPRQIGTPYRRRIEAALNWTPFAPDL